MSKDKLIVVSWSLMHNWIYVVLSHVRTLDGLFLLRPFPDNCLDKFEVPKDLILFEDIICALEAAVLVARERGVASLEM